MATEKQGEGQVKKSKTKMIIIIIGIVVLLASAAGSYFFVIKKNPSSTHKEVETKPEVSTYELGSIVVNLADQGHNLRVSPVLEYDKDEKLLEELKGKKSQIIDQVITILRKKTVGNLSAADSVEKTKAEILEGANKCLEEPKFKRLFFVEMLVQ